MPEHHRESDIDGLWKATNENREEISDLKAERAKTDANYVHIKESLARLEAITATFSDQVRAHSVEDGRYYARIEQTEHDIDAMALKIREHVENHKFWLGITLGVPAILLTLWELADHLLRRTNG